MIPNPDCLWSRGHCRSLGDPDCLIRGPPPLRLGDDVQRVRACEKATVFTIKSVFPVVVILALLANKFAGVHAVGLFVNQARLGIKGEAYAQTEFATTFRSAIKDAYLSEKYRESIAFRAKQCNLIETPITTIPSLEEPTNPETPSRMNSVSTTKRFACIQSMVTYIQGLQAEVAAECEKGCTGTTSASSRI